jgi:hypothetical protein
VILECEGDNPFEEPFDRCGDIESFGVSAPRRIVGSPRLRLEFGCAEAAPLILVQGLSAASDEDSLSLRRRFAEVVVIGSSGAARSAGIAGTVVLLLFGAESSGKGEAVEVEVDGWSVANGVREGCGALSARSKAVSTVAGTGCLEMGAVGSLAQSNSIRDSPTSTGAVD